MKGDLIRFSLDVLTCFCVKRKCCRAEPFIKSKIILLNKERRGVIAIGSVHLLQKYLLRKIPSFLETDQQINSYSLRSQGKCINVHHGTCARYL